MSEYRSSFARATLMLIGTIIGAGVFGVPAVIQRLGLLAGSILFWIVATLALATHLLFIEIIARDRHRRRLPGYVGAVLGAWAEWLGAAVHSLHLIFADLAYLVLAGSFLSIIIEHFGFAPGVFVWQILFWCIGIVAVAFGLKRLTSVANKMTWVLLIMMGLMIMMATSQIKLPLPSMGDWRQSSVGLGVFLFAVSGFTTIPEIFEIANKRIRETRLVVMTGSLLSSFLIWLFGVTVYLALPGADLSAPSTLSTVFPTFGWWVLPLFGFLAVATAFFISIYDIHAMYIYDLRLKPSLSWVLAFGAPLILLLMTSRNFLSIINTAGAFFSTTSGLLIAVAALVVMRRAKKTPPWWWSTLMPCLVALLFVTVLLQRITAFTLH